MVEHAKPFSRAECVAQLQSVLSWLDVAGHRSPSAADMHSVAAAHVQQAVELIQSAEKSEA